MKMWYQLQQCCIRVSTESDSVFYRIKRGKKGGERQFDKDCLSVGFASVEGCERLSFRIGLKRSRWVFNSCFVVRWISDAVGQNSDSRKM